MVNERFHSKALSTPRLLLILGGGSLALWAAACTLKGNSTAGNSPVIQTAPKPSVSPNISAALFIRMVVPASVPFNLHQATLGVKKSAYSSYDFVNPPSTDSSDPTISTDTNFCKVHQSDVGTSAADVLCFAEFNEGDLFYNGYGINFNVPASMCSYVLVQRPWHYKYPIGRGPTYASYYLDNTVVPPAYRPADSFNFITKGGIGKAFCPFDYSNFDVSYNFQPGPLGQMTLPSQTPNIALFDSPAADRPNCCLGRYSMTATTKFLPPSNPPPAPAPAPSITTVNTVESWGSPGINPACLGGPGATDHKNRLGLPEGDMMPVPVDGVNQTTVISSASVLAGEYSFGNMSVANYYSSTDYDSPILMPPAYLPSNNRTPPVPYYPPPQGNLIPHPEAAAVAGVDQYGNPLPQANPFYIVNCLDSSLEVKAKIRLLVRSWDKVAAASSGVTGAASLANYYKSTPGEETFSANAFTSNHDDLTWDDIIPVVLPSYSPPYNNGINPTGPTPVYQNYLMGYPGDLY